MSIASFGTAIVTGLFQRSKVTAPEFPPSTNSTGYGVPCVRLADHEPDGDHGNAVNARQAALHERAVGKARRVAELAPASKLPA